MTHAVEGSSNQAVGHRATQQAMNFAAFYGAEFLAISDGCLGWDPVMDVVCGDGSNTIAELSGGDIRLGDENSPPVSCFEHPVLGQGAIRCRIPSNDPTVPLDNFAVVAFFLVGLSCRGPTRESVVATANFLPASLVCDANHLAFHSVYIRVLKESLVDDFVCQPADSFGQDDDGIQYCIRITDCAGERCSIPIVSAIQKSPMSDDSLLFLGSTEAPTPSPTTAARRETFWTLLMDLIRRILESLTDMF